MGATLNPGQQRAVDHGKGPLLVLAGPGSGKTRVVTYRAARLLSAGVSPQRLLLVTFTRKAATEMRGRISKLVGGGKSKGMWIGTFHAICARLLRGLDDDRWRSGRPRDFTIYSPDEGKAIVKAVTDELGLDRKEYKPAESLESISQHKGEAMSPDELVVDDETGENLVRIWRGYEAALRRAGAFDYDDLLAKAMVLAESDTSVGRAWRRLFEHVIVDEYQDTNSVQFRLVNALGAAENLCVVGDHRQSIYAFRGADWRNIGLFRQRFPGCAEVHVDVNYRSTGHVVGCFNALFDDCVMTTPNEPGPLCDVREFGDADQEARAIVHQVLSRLAQGVSPTELAVLYRVHVLSRPIEEQLRHAGVSYQIAGGLGYYDRAEVRDVLAYLRVVANPDSHVDVERVINLPPRRLGAKVVAKLRACAARRGCGLYDVLPVAPALGDFSPTARKGMSQFHLLIKQAVEQLGSRPLSEVVAELVGRSGLRQMHLAEADKWKAKRDHVKAERASDKADRVADIAASVAAYERRVSAPTLHGFLEEVALISAADDLDEPKVSLMTIHAAKGLEFESVWVAGLEEELLPFVRATSKEEIQEELRLMFVACSRARRWLTVSYATERFLHGKWQQRDSSRFLDMLPEEHRRWPERDELAQLQAQGTGCRP